jgi:hypothetical protein
VVISLILDHDFFFTIIMNVVTFIEHSKEIVHPSFGKFSFIK